MPAISYKKMIRKCTQIFAFICGLDLLLCLVAGMARSCNKKLCVFA